MGSFGLVIILITCFVFAFILVGGKDLIEVFIDYLIYLYTLCRRQDVQVPQPPGQPRLTARPHYNWEPKPSEARKNYDKTLFSKHNENTSGPLNNDLGKLKPEEEVIPSRTYETPTCPVKNEEWQLESEARIQENYNIQFSKRMSLSKNNLLLEDQENENVLERSIRNNDLSQPERQEGIQEVHLSRGNEAPTCSSNYDERQQEPEERIQEDYKNKVFCNRNEKIISFTKNNLWRPEREERKDSNVLYGKKNQRRIPNNDLSQPEHQEGIQEDEAQLGRRNESPTRSSNDERLQEPKERKQEYYKNKVLFCVRNERMNSLSKNNLWKPEAQGQEDENILFGRKNERQIPNNDLSQRERQDGIQEGRRNETPTFSSNNGERLQEPEVRFEEDNKSKVLFIKRKMILSKKPCWQPGSKDENTIFSQKNDRSISANDLCQVSFEDNTVRFEKKEERKSMELEMVQIAESRTGEQGIEIEETPTNEEQENNGFGPFSLC